MLINASSFYCQKPAIISNKVSYNNTKLLKTDTVSFSGRNAEEDAGSSISLKGILGDRIAKEKASANKKAEQERATSEKKWERETRLVKSVYEHPQVTELNKEELSLLEQLALDYVMACRRNDCAQKPEALRMFNAEQLETLAESNRDYRYYHQDGRPYSSRMRENCSPPSYYKSPKERYFDNKAAREIYEAEQEAERTKPRFVKLLEKVMGVKILY
ncbi:MAG: hypothetical protein AB1782_00740 [Cyanobacteriota bacterium]